MKRPNATCGTAAIVLALMLGPATALRAETIAAGDLRQNLFASCFVNDKEGWAVGDLGRIFHTTDGAATWEIQDADTKRPFVALACPDRDHVWATGQVGQIVFSSDQGKTWNRQNSGTERQLLDISFANTELGLAIGDYGVLLRTDDGGTTWTRISMPVDTKLPPDIAEVVQPGDVLLYKAAFVGPQHAWIVGEFGVILKSEDGGLTWTSQDSPVETTLFGVFFVDEQKGWATGIESTLLQSNDGGTSWKRVKISMPKDFPLTLLMQLALYDVSVQGTYGWAVGSSGFLVNSTDAGESWGVVSVPTILRGSWFRSISLLPDGTGYIVGARGTVLSTARDGFAILKNRE